MPEPAASNNRRPLASRDTGWARALSAALAKAGASPDLISFLSIPIAVAGAAVLLFLPASAGPLLCALAVQLRLLCNLLDGMVAVEGGRGGPTGPLWNELPDRVADSVFLIALGYAGGFAWAGWAAALFAALTAYVRAIGGSLGFGQDFSGWFAKPRRMFFLTLACLVAATAPVWPEATRVLGIAAIGLAAGSALTCGGRTLRLARQLRARAATGATALAPAATATRTPDVEPPRDTGTP